MEAAVKQSQSSLQGPKSDKREPQMGSYKRREKVQTNAKLDRKPRNLSQFAMNPWFFHSLVHSVTKEHGVYMEPQGSEAVYL